MKQLLILLIISASVFSCTKQRFIVLDNVPDTPSFVVIPANNSMYQTEYANSVESGLLGTGVSVLDAPPRKSVTVRRQSDSSTDADEEDTGSQPREIVEDYETMYGETKADYIIRTFADSERARIIRKETREVISSFSVRRKTTGNGKRESHTDVIKEALRSMDIDVNE